MGSTSPAPAQCRILYVIGDGRPLQLPARADDSCLVNKTGWGGVRASLAVQLPQPLTVREFAMHPSATIAPRVTASTAASRQTLARPLLWTPISCLAFLQEAGKRVGSLGAEFEADRGRLDGLRQRLRAERCHLAVLGQFKRGKSTLVNALLGAPVLPTAVVPLTSIPTFLHDGGKLAASVLFDDGKAEERFAGPDASVGKGDRSNLPERPGGRHRRERWSSHKLDLSPFPTPRAWPTSWPASSPRAPTLTTGWASEWSKPRTLRRCWGKAWR